MNYCFFLWSLLSLLLSVSAEPAFGKPIIPNECGSLGTNNPMIAKDCQTFKLSKWILLLFNYHSDLERANYRE